MCVDNWVVVGLLEFRSEFNANAVSIQAWLKMHVNWVRFFSVAG